MEKRRSPWVAIILAVVIGVMVIVLLNGVINPTTVVVAKVAIAPGTPLTADLLELRTIPSQAKPADALTRIEDLQNKVLAVGRAPGDYITTSVLGDTSQAGIPASLQPDHLAIAVKVDLGSGIAGLLREGQKVTLIGMLSPDVLHSIAAPATLVNSPFQIEPTALPSSLSGSHSHPHADADPTRSSFGAHRHQRFEGAYGAAVLSLPRASLQLGSRSALRQRPYRLGCARWKRGSAGCAFHPDRSRSRLQGQPLNPRCCPEQVRQPVPDARIG